MFPSALEAAMPPRNSRNWVERMMVYGMPEVSISFSWATLARKYPLSGDRSVPTMDSATWCRTPAADSAARRLRPETLSANVRETAAPPEFSVEGEQAKAARDHVVKPCPRSPSPPDGSDVQGQEAVLHRRVQEEGSCRKSTRVHGVRADRRAASARGAVLVAPRRRGAGCVSSGELAGLDAEEARSQRARRRTHSPRSWRRRSARSRGSRPRTRSCS